MLTLLTVLLVPTQAPPPPVHPFAAQGVIVYPTPEQFLEVANMLRAGHNLPPLQNDLRMYDCAEEYAHVNARIGFISHNHPCMTDYGTTPQRRLAKHNVKITSTKEILCGGPQMLGRDPFALWRASPGHYAHILSNCTHCGFAVAYDRSGYGYWVGIFATLAP